MLVFVHIPKTAGTTLHKILSHQYPVEKIWIHHDGAGPWSASELKQLGVGSPCRPELIMGHLGTGLHKQFPEVRYITCLRHPVARLVSHYHHALDDRDHYLHHAVTHRRLDLAAYVASGLSGELSNGMTRMIAGIEDFDGALLGPEDLELAKHNLETCFDAVLLSERFDEGLLMLAESLGWTTPYYIRRKIGRYLTCAGELDPDVRRIIEEHNALDLALYQWSRERFDARLTCKKFPDRVYRFRQRNRYIGKLVFAVREIYRRKFFKLRWGVGSSFNFKL